MVGGGEPLLFVCLVLQEKVYGPARVVGEVSRGEVGEARVEAHVEERFLCHPAWGGGL